MAEIFGHMPDGRPVHRVCLTGGGLTAHFITYGAVLQDLRLDGHEHPLVLGFDSFDLYPTKSRYYGATAGRCANRIGNAHLQLDGRTYQLDPNADGTHMLHGGSNGCGKQLWTLKDVAEDRLAMEITLPDGQMGFPGNLDIRAEFALLPGGVLDVTYRAITDAPTLCNLAHHSYFCLDDGGSITNHTLQVEADHVTEIAEGLVPTGALIDVAGTKFDFRDADVIGAREIDHNYCVSQRRVPMRRVATLASPKSGVKMECLTTEPGVQIYLAANMNVTERGLNGQPLGAHAGLAMEPQIWPDAHQHPYFPQAVLRPGDTYLQHTQFKFSKDQS